MGPETFNGLTKCMVLTFEARRIKTQSHIPCLVYDFQSACQHRLWLVMLDLSLFTVLYSKDP